MSCAQNPSIPVATPAQVVAAILALQHACTKLAKRVNKVMSPRYIAFKSRRENALSAKCLVDVFYLVGISGLVSAERKAYALKGVKRNFFVVTNAQVSAKTASQQGSTSVAHTSFRSAVFVDTVWTKCHALEWPMIAKKLVFLPASTLRASTYVLGHVQHNAHKNAVATATTRSAVSPVVNPAAILLARRHVINTPFSDVTTPVLEYVVKSVQTSIALSARKLSSTTSLKE